MQAEATDSSLREGIEALGVKDTETPAAVQEAEGSTEQQDTEMTAVTEEDATTKDEKGNSMKKQKMNSIGRGIWHLHFMTRSMKDVLPQSLYLDRLKVFI